jgi:hypothetical protein
MSHLILRINVIRDRDGCDHIGDLLGVGASVLSIGPNDARVISFPPGWKLELYTDAEINTSREPLNTRLLDEKGRVRAYIQAGHHTTLTPLRRYATLYDCEGGEGAPDRISVVDRDCNDSCLRVIGMVEALDNDQLFGALLTAGEAWLDQHFPGWRAYNYGRD